MCGLAGHLRLSYRVLPPLVTASFSACAKQWSVAGRTGQDLWISEDRQVGLAHRRLAIIDTSDAGAQPMSTSDGAFRIVCNGEIYNYRELREELRAKGYRFVTQSDTEVLLHLYREHGREMVHKLRGMYRLSRYGTQGSAACF